MAELDGEIGQHRGKNERESLIFVPSVFNLGKKLSWEQQIDLIEPRKNDNNQISNTLLSSQEYSFAT